MAGRGRLLLLEAIILPGNAPALSKLMDLTMQLLIDISLLCSGRRPI
jgi:hypothetical protein